MGRLPQKLINYNSILVYSGLTGENLTNLEKLNIGEIVVMHNPLQPMLGIRVAEGDEPSLDNFAWFIDSAAVVTAINSIEGTAGDLVTKINALSSATETFSGDVYTKYATSADTVAAIDSAIKDLDAGPFTGTSSQTLTSISETDGKISASYSPIFIEQSQVSGLTELATEVGTNSTNITTLSGHVFDTIADYATKTEVSAHVQTEIGKLDVSDIEGFGAGKTLASLSETDGKIEATFQDIEVGISQVTGLSGQLFTIKEDVQTNATNIGTVSGNVVNLSGTVESLSANVYTTLGTVYRVQGSVADIDALNAVTGQSIGDVYNVIAASGTPGTGGYIPAGTNYVWVQYPGEEGDGHWDPMGGTVNLTGYATSADTYNAITGVNNTISTHISGDFANVSGLVNSISATVTSDYATKAELGAAISGLDMSEVTLLPSETLHTIEEADGKVTVTKQDIAIVTSAITDFSTFSTELTAATTNISSLSSATQTIEETANESISAVTTGVVSTPENTTNNAYASGVKINTDNTTRGVTFDFSELVIDCGDF